MNNNPPKELTAMALFIANTTPKKALLVQSKKHQLWMPPGGHVEPNENMFEAAVRETREEVGIDITPYFEFQAFGPDRTQIPTPERIVEIKLFHGGREHYHVDCMYRVFTEDTLPFTLQDDEHSDGGWFTYDQTQDMSIPDDLRPVLAKELKD